MLADGREMTVTWAPERPTAGLVLLRPARSRESQPPRDRFFRALRQVIESVNDTLKGRLDLERHGGHTPR
jgi:hypothetical protein